MTQRELYSRMYAKKSTQGTHHGLYNILLNKSIDYIAHLKYTNKIGEVNLKKFAGKPIYFAVWIMSLKVNYFKIEIWKNIFI